MEEDSVIRYVSQIRGPHSPPSLALGQKRRATGRPGGAVTATTLGTGNGSGVWAPLDVLDAGTEVIRCIINELR